MSVVPHEESFHGAVPRLCQSDSTCTNGTFFWLIYWTDGVSEERSCRKVFFRSGKFLISSPGTGREMLLQMVQGTDFPLSRWDYCFLWRLLSFHREPLLHSFGLSGSWFLQGVCLWFLLRWWMVERAEAVLGDWLWGSWQEIKLYFCSMNQWRHLESSTSLLWAFGSVLVVLSAFSKSLWKHRGGMPVLVCEELWPYATAGAACASFWEHI